jgi:hypothetical protein
VNQRIHPPHPRAAVHSCRVHRREKGKRKEEEEKEEKKIPSLALNVALTARGDARAHPRTRDLYRRGGKGTLGEKFLREHRAGGEEVALYNFTRAFRVGDRPAALHHRVPLRRNLPLLISLL